MEPRGRGVFWTKQRPTDSESLFLLSTPSFDTDIANLSHPGPTAYSVRYRPCFERAWELGRVHAYDALRQLDK